MIGITSTDTIINADCMQGMNDIADKSIDLCITDPPYWHKKSPGKPYSQRKQCKTDSAFSNSALYNYEGEMIKGMSDFDDKCINSFLTALEPKMKIMNSYIFCSETQVPYYAMWAENNGYMFSILVWEKPLSIINKNRFSQNLEYIVRIYDYGTALNRLDNNELYNRCKKTAPVSGSKKVHPTEKPIELIQQFILLSSNEGDVVLDPYIGSGTTAIACHRTHRHFIGFEINSEFFQKAERRIKAEQAQMSLFD
jgi:DNA modification methylase